MKKDYESQIEALGQDNKKLKLEVDSVKMKLAQITIDNDIRMAVAGLSVKLHKGTTEDIIARGRRIFTMDYDKNIPVARNSEGNLLFGKDGMTSLTIKEWVEGLPNSAPHLFKSSAGSGGKRKFGMTREEFAKLPPSERLKRIHSTKEKAA